MQLIQLRMLVAIVVEGSIQKAAERVSRTVPAVKIALEKLAIEIGTPVFDYAKRHEYALTPTGELLVDYARRMLALHDEALVAVNEISKGHCDTMRIGTNESINLYVLPQLTQMFHELCPEVKVAVSSHQSDVLLPALFERRLDVALLAYCPSDRRLETYPLMTDDLVVIMSPKHHLASKEALRIQDLGMESIITEGGASPLHNIVVETFRRFHTPLHVPIECETIETIKKMVGRKLGVAIVPWMCVQEESERGELKHKHITGFREERTVWVARRRNDFHCRTSQVFMEVTKSMAKKKCCERVAMASGRDSPLSLALPK